jgi:hypothetical protein
VELIMVAAAFFIGIATGATIVFVVAIIAGLRHEFGEDE